METRNFNLATLTPTSDAFQAVPCTTVAESKALYNAINNPMHNLADCIGEVIEIANAHITAEKRVNDEDEEFTKYRTTIIAKDGTTYYTTYTRLAKSLMTLFATFGTPDTWDEPIRVVAREMKFNGGFHSTLVFDLV